VLLEITLGIGVVVFGSGAGVTVFGIEAGSWLAGAEAGLHPKINAIATITICAFIKFSHLIRISFHNFRLSLHRS
jgi:hypothetical protein